MNCGTTSARKTAPETQNILRNSKNRARVSWRGRRYRKNSAHGKKLHMAKKKFKEF
jgi:hypothetical protein